MESEIQPAEWEKRELIDCDEALIGQGSDRCYKCSPAIRSGIE